MQARPGPPALALGSAFHSVGGLQAGFLGQERRLEILEMRILGPSPELLTHGLRGAA